MYVLTLLGSRPRYGAFYGQGSGPIFLSGLGCSGSENRLLNCSRDVLGGEYCNHYEDAGVACQGTVSYNNVFNCHLSQGLSLSFLVVHLVLSLVEKLFSFLDLISSCKIL